MAKRSSNREKEYEGVRMRKWGKWVSEIRIPRSKSRLWLGSYSTAEQAARAYDVAVYCLRGPDAPLNFPNSPPRIPTAIKLSTYQIQSAAFEAASSIHSSSSHSAPPHDNFQCHLSSAALPEHNILSPPLSGEYSHISDELSGLCIPAHDVGVGMTDELVPCENDYLYFPDFSEQADDNLWSSRL